MIRLGSERTESTAGGNRNMQQLLDGYGAGVGHSRIAIQGKAIPRLRFTDAFKEVSAASGRTAQTYPRARAYAHS